MIPESEEKDHGKEEEIPPGDVSETVLN